MPDSLSDGMKIGGLQRTSLNEYPGKICAIIFTQGCNFRCHYCHNPELVLPELFARPIPEEEIFAFLKNRPLLEGVTITGGEPCLQNDLPAFLQQLRSCRLAIKLNTNGSFPRVLETILAYRLVDYVSLDIKTSFPRYQEVTSVPVDTETIRDSLKLLLHSGIEYDLRTTVVRGLLNEDDLHTIGQLVQGASKYIFQQFLPSKTVNPEFLRREAPAEVELEKFQRIMAQYVEKCEIY